MPLLPFDHFNVSLLNKGIIIFIYLLLLLLLLTPNFWTQCVIIFTSHIYILPQHLFLLDFLSYWKQFLLELTNFLLVKSSSSSKLSFFFFFLLFVYYIYCKYHMSLCSFSKWIAENWLIDVKHRLLNCSHLMCSLYLRLKGRFSLLKNILNWD